jgi:DNA-damage-inducible protein J
MPKSAYITARVEPELKARAESVLKQIGLSTTDAVTLFLHQVVLRRGLPFSARIPNKETREAIAELDAGGGEVFHGTNKEFFDHLLGKTKK